MKASFYAYLLFLLANCTCSYADSHHPQEFLESVRGAKDEGLQIYNHFCANCHAANPKIPLGAPRFRIEEEWTNRLEQGMKILLQHTDEGINAMPPRGGCFECSDEQLILAICNMIKKNTLCNNEKIKKISK